MTGKIHLQNSQVSSRYEPFTSDTSLQSISTGVHAHTTVNVDKAKRCWKCNSGYHEAKTAAEYNFKKKDQVITLDTKNAVKVDGIAVQIDPQLFQRLTIIAAKATDKFEDVFRYMSYAVIHQPFLTHRSLLLREPQKPVLANAIWNLLAPDISEITGEVQYVLDGGALIQRIPWTRGATYQEICSVYARYVSKKCEKAVVVFDGYSGKSTETQRMKDEQKGVLE